MGKTVFWVTGLFWSPKTEEEQMQASSAFIFATISKHRTWLLIANKLFMAKGTCGCRRNSPPHHGVLWTGRTTLHCQEHVNTTVGFFHREDTIRSGFPEVFTKCLASTFWEGDPLSCCTVGSPSQAHFTHQQLKILTWKTWHHYVLACWSHNLSLRWGNELGYRFFHAVFYISSVTLPTNPTVCFASKNCQALYK